MVNTFYNTFVWAQTKRIIKWFIKVNLIDLIINTFAQYALNPATRKDPWRMPLWPWASYSFRFRWYYACNCVIIFISAVVFEYVVDNELGYVYRKTPGWPWWYHPLSIFFCWLWHSIIQYHYHVALHSDFLWNTFHQYHHHYIHPRPFNDLAVHPGEYITFNLLCMYPQIFFIPMHVNAFYAYNLLVGIPAILEHSGTDVHLGTFWTALDHELHHVKYRVNFDTPLPIWDILFGTYDGKWLGIDWPSPQKTIHIAPLRSKQIGVESFYDQIRALEADKDALRSMPGQVHLNSIRDYQKKIAS